MLEPDAGAEGNVFTVIVMVVEEAGLPVGQVTFDVSTQYTGMLPLAKLLVVYVEVVLFCTEEPLTYQLYEGDVPPLVGVVVKVTLVPEHIVEEGLTEPLTLTALFAFTVIVIVLEDAGLPVAQVIFEVITQYTGMLPLAKSL